jgi:hypothetical protein
LEFEGYRDVAVAVDGEVENGLPALVGSGSLTDELGIEDLRARQGCAVRTEVERPGLIEEERGAGRLPHPRSTTLEQ